jgi:hypothetical protein
MNSSYIYTQSNEEMVTEYTKEVIETDEELVISFQFSQTMDTNKVDEDLLSTIEKEGLIESINKI